MDTRYWGPDGWKLLHTITYNYPIEPCIDDIMNHKLFFYIIGDILPCKYCRISYKQYIKDLPPDNFLNSRNDVFKWLYLIHNMINNKLRKQGHITFENPSYEEIYEKYSKKPNMDECLIGSCFLKAIVYNYPEVINKDSERIKRLYYMFFNYLMIVYPNSSKELLINFNASKNIYNNLNNRNNIKKWYYILCCYIEKNCKDIKPYNIFCRDCEKYRSKACIKTNHKGTTCRIKEKPIKDKKLKTRKEKDK